jgi:hypothetical protein
VIIFYSVRFGFYQKKSNQNIKKTKTGSNRLVLVRFLGQKPVQNRFGSVFSGLARFFRFGSVLFGFFGFKLIKPNRLVF